jgi:DNA-binding response OmpR family regulator
MTDGLYHLATVLLYDPDPSLRHNTRTALLNIGFGDVVAVEDFSIFLEKAATGNFDLVLADTRSPEENTLETIRDIRQNIMGKNTFVNIIVSLWDTSPDAVSNVINSGADDLISRPMSRSNILERVVRLVRARKPFIVTADYVGPDRRFVPRGYPEGSALVVPNSLQAKVENKPEFAATPESIQAAIKAVSDRKISIYTEQLLRLSSAIILLSGGFDERGDRQGVVQAMQQIAEQLEFYVKETKFAHVESLCSGLKDVLQNIENSQTALSDQQRELIIQIPFAIQKACKEVQESAALVFDIRDLSAQLRRQTVRQTA